MVKKFDQERRDQSTYFAHFWLVPEGDIGCLLALAGRYKPRTGFCHKPYEVTTEVQSRAPHLFCAGCVIHSHEHAAELVKYSRKRVCWENKELELQASLPCPEESWTSPPPPPTIERLLLNHERHQESWPPKKNSIRGQR